MKSLFRALAFVALAACSTSTPVPELETAGQKMVKVTSKPVTFFQQGVTGARNMAPSVQAITIDFTCIASFDGRSPQARANRSMQYSVLARERATSWLVNPRIKGGWIREIQAQSVPNEGCEPDYKSIKMRTVTTNAVEVMTFVMRHEGARRFITR